MPGRNQIPSDPFNFSYQGQETMDINGIKLVNFELRNYDPYLGRWMSADPYHQFYSPYLAMFNNPVRFVDPDGGWASGPGDPLYDEIEFDKWRQQLIQRDMLEGRWNEDLYGMGGTDASGMWYNWDEMFARAALEFYRNNPGIQYTDYNLVTDDQDKAKEDGKTLKYNPVVTNYTNKKELTEAAQFWSKQWSEKKADQDGWYDLFSQLSAMVGAGGTISEHVPGSFRLGTVKQGFSPKYYKNAWTGNQYAKTFNISKIGRIAGGITVGVGIAADIKGVINYYKNGADDPNSVHPAKAATNTTVAIYGIWINPFAAVAYFGVDAFYPGGIEGAMINTGKVSEDNIELFGPHWRLIPFGGK